MGTAGYAPSATSQDGFTSDVVSRSPMTLSALRDGRSRYRFASPTRRRSAGPRPSINAGGVSHELGRERALRARYKSLSRGSSAASSQSGWAAAVGPAAAAWRTRNATNLTSASGTPTSPTPIPPWKIPSGRRYVRPDVLLADLVWAATLAAVFSQDLVPHYLYRPRRKTPQPAGSKPAEPYAFISSALVETLAQGGHPEAPWPGSSEQ